MDLLRFDGADIVLQEVPDEVSLVLNITECPHHCVGCHSAYLAESYGDYVEDKLPELLGQYENLISCVCFMGGDQHIKDLEKQCRYIKKKSPELKVAIYTGHDNAHIFNALTDVLDYIKIGHFDESLGGLDSPTTNQRMYKKEGDRWTDITYRFQKNHDET